MEYKFLDDAKLLEKPMRVREFTIAIGTYDPSIMTRFVASWEVCVLIIYYVVRVRCIYPYRQCFCYPKEFYKILWLIIGNRLSKLELLTDLISFLKRNINALESIQCQFTKKISGHSGLFYNDRLRELGALTLEHRRRYIDMVTVYKYLHGLVNDTPSSVGIEVIQIITRGSGTRLKQQHAKSRVCANFFRVRVAQCWNKLSLPILNSKSISVFKRSYYKHLFNELN